MTKEDAIRCFEDMKKKNNGFVFVDADFVIGIIRKILPESAHWIIYYSSTDPKPYYSKCSCCGNIVKSDEEYVISAFCSSCGFKMDEEVEAL